MTIIIILWYIIGILSFIYWWTSDNDLTTSSLISSFVVGMLGPIAFLLGHTIHGEPIVILKQRRNK